MIAFEVYLNGNKICTAGVGSVGVLSTSVCWVKRDTDTSSLTDEELTVDIGGLVPPAGDHLHWNEQPLQVGDQVCVKIVEADIVDEPSVTKPTDPIRDKLAQKQYVREMAKQLGWRIQES